MIRASPGWIIAISSIAMSFLPLQKTMFETISLIFPSSINVLPSALPNDLPGSIKVNLFR
jgi:hypothetical protein